MGIAADRIAADWHAAFAALAWQVEAGVDEVILDTPVNRYALPTEAPKAAPAPAPIAAPAAPAALSPETPGVDAVQAAQAAAPWMTCAPRSRALPIAT